MEATVANTLHVTSSAISFLTCLVVLLCLLRPASVGTGQPLAASRTAAGAWHKDCLLAVADGWWQRTPPKVPIPDLPLNIAVRNLADAFTAFNESLAYQWGWHLYTRCDIRRRSRSEIADLLRSRRLAFMGDSHVRQFHNWLVQAVGGKPYFVPAKLPESQHNSVQVVPALNTTVQINMTHLASEIHRYLEAWSGQWPDLLLMDASVWHLYTLKNISEYTRQMDGLLGFLKAEVPPTTVLIWLSPPPRHTLKAPWWNELPAEWIRLYNRVAVDLGFMYPTGPAHHLDLYSLALDCLPWCSKDGLHVVDSGYELALQILANLLAQLEGWR